jgi:hypothetical protein
VESGTFKNTGIPPVIRPGQSIPFSFYGVLGQYFTFASMYGSSNDLFFAPVNQGIKLYNDNGTPVTGDVTSYIDLYDDGTTVGQYPGAGIRPAPEASRAILPLPNPNQSTTLAATGSIIKVTLQ